MDIVTYALCKKYTNSKISELGSVLKFKGIVATVSALPTSNNKKGDVWIVSDTSSEYVWTSDTVSTGSDYWELLGAAIGTGKYTTTVTVDVSHNVFDITHGLNTTDVVCLVYDTNGYEVIVDCQRTGLNTVTISFSNAATYGTYNVALIVPQGPTGAAGYSPSATVTKSGHTATVSITDKTGTTSTTITEPTATVNKVDTTATITITDVDGTHTATISDGEKGEPGDISDVQINSVSIKSGGTANIPLAGASTLGVVKAKSKTSTDIVEVSVDSAGKLYVPESGKVDDVKIGSTSIVSNKIATIPSATTSVVGVTQLNNTVTSTSTDQALTANIGKELQDQISNLKNIGRFLAIWNCTTGLPTSNPTVSPYAYKTGDYFRVGTISTTPYSLTWDGDTTGKISIDDTFYKISNTPISKTDVIGGTLILITASATYTYTITNEDVMDLTDNIYCVEEGLLIALNDTTFAGESVDKGVYFRKDTSTGAYYSSFTLTKAINYMPSGSSYTTGVASTTVYTGTDLSIGAVFYYDGSVWRLQASGGGGTVQDVVIADGASLLSGGTAVIPLSSDSANGAMTSGQYTKLNSVENGAEVNILEGVQVNGTDLTIDANKKVNIPMGSDGVLGVVKPNSTRGVSINTNGELLISAAGGNEIVLKANPYHPVVPSNLDIAVREGLGNNSLTWSDTYKANARNTIGAGTPYTVTVNID